MDPMLIIGWLFLLAAWFPKPFVKDERLRLKINLSLAGFATGIFIAGLISQFIK
jgi:hypothetical protein